MAKKKQQPESAPPPEANTCAACGEFLAVMPVNSRVKMIACANRRCNLYRQRIRYASI